MSGFTNVIENRHARQIKYRDAYRPSRLYRARTGRREVVVWLNSEIVSPSTDIGRGQGVLSKLLIDGEAELLNSIRPEVRSDGDNRTRKVRQITVVGERGNPSLNLTFGTKPDAAVFVTGP